MKQRRFWPLVFLCLLFAALCCTACGKQKQAESTAAESQGAAESLAKADDAGLTADSRVVALSRSLGELWLLAGGKLVGVTEDGLNLEGVTAETASVGRILAPSAEAIIALNPDLVLIAPDISAQRELQATLEAAGIRCQAVDINKFSDYATAMKQYTEATGRSDLYESKVAAVEKNIETIKAELPKEIHGKSFLVIRASAAKTRVLKSDHFVVAMLEDLGLTNAAPESLLEQLSMEGIVEANPDYLFVVLQGDTAEAEAAFQELIAAQPAYQELKAVKTAQVYTLPKEFFQYKPNARWDEAYALLSEYLRRASLKQ
nr:ABC transporter substrate-binding protein [uncultured Stomatobaculum sp.]